jgi:hypothetical protein
VRLFATGAGAGLFIFPCHNQYLNRRIFSTPIGMLGSGKSALTHDGDTFWGCLTGKFIVVGSKGNEFFRKGKAF